MALPRATGPAELVLHNAHVLTMHPRWPRASWVAVKGERILGVGEGHDFDSLQGAQTQAIDAGGRTLIPGFHDAHCHLMAYAASLRAMDCGPDAVSSLRDIRAALAKRVSQTSPGTWIQGWGYNEFHLAEKRHPTRHDLDSRTPHHPVRLRHRSLHACVLNTLALKLAGIGRDTPDPPGGYIERGEDGEPTGLLLEMDAWLSEEIIPLPRPEELALNLRLASQRLLSLGITSLQETSYRNTPAQWELLGRFMQEGVIAPRVTFFPGFDFLGEFKELGLEYGQARGRMALGPAKYLISNLEDCIPPQELEDLVWEAERAGFPLAVHAVEAAVVERVAAALESRRRRARQGNGSGPREEGGWRHRVEHASECPPSVLARLARSGATVVSQPAFLYYSGERYLSEVSPEMRPHLYPFRSIVKAGVPLAFSSDAPVVPPNPLVGIYAAVARRAASGAVLSSAESLTARQALTAYTRGGAYATGQEQRLGTVSPGQLADLALLSADPTAVPAEEVKGIRVEMTIIGGRVAWRTF